MGIQEHAGLYCIMEIFGIELYVLFQIFRGISWFSSQMCVFYIESGELPSLMNGSVHTYVLRFSRQF
jgi:hypothetical protein